MSDRALKHTDYPDPSSNPKLPPKIVFLFANTADTPAHLLISHTSTCQFLFCEAHDKKAFKRKRTYTAVLINTLNSSGGGNNQITVFVKNAAVFGDMSL